MIASEAVLLICGFVEIDPKVQCFKIIMCSVSSAAQFSWGHLRRCSQITRVKAEAAIMGRPFYSWSAVAGLEERSVFTWFPHGYSELPYIQSASRSGVPGADQSCKALGPSLSRSHTSVLSEGNRFYFSAVAKMAHASR